MNEITIKVGIGIVLLTIFCCGYFLGYNAVMDNQQIETEDKNKSNITIVQTDPWWNASWKNRTDTCEMFPELCEPLPRGNYSGDISFHKFDNNYSDVEDIRFDSEAINIRITSSFSVQDYSIEIPLENIYENCSDLLLVMGGDAYPCYHYDSPPFYMWDAPPCIIFDDVVWVKMDLHENETYIIYFYYGEDARC